MLWTQRHNPCEHCEPPKRHVGCKWGENKCREWAEYELKVKEDREKYHKYKQEGVEYVQMVGDRFASHSHDNRTRKRWRR